MLLQASQKKTFCVYSHTRTSNPRFRLSLWAWNVPFKIHSEGWKYSLTVCLASDEEYQCSQRRTIWHEQCNETHCRSYNGADSEVMRYVTTKISSRCSLALVFHFIQSWGFNWMHISCNGAEDMANRYEKLKVKAHWDSANALKT